LLALKTIPLIIYPTYAEFINFSSGFMVVDMHWLNKLLPTIFSQKIDVSPKGFYFFFTSMNFAGMNLITFSIFIGLLILGYIALKEP
jgi:disulfide bond formation protein DsbB